MSITSINDCEIIFMSRTTKKKMNQAFSRFKTFAPILTCYFLLQQAPSPNEKKYRNNNSRHIITISGQINIE